MDRAKRTRLDWHRLFGLMLTDYFTGTGYRVEMEVDLSLRRQLLDVVVVRRDEAAACLPDACDGFDDLADHNLITYKSMRESLTAWSLEELIGHDVNYRKKLGRRAVRAGGVRLLAVCTRYPRGLARSIVLKPRPRTAGVYDVLFGTRPLRVIVLSEIRDDQRNAVLEFFSAQAEKVRAAADCYRFRSPDLTTLINELYRRYQAEGLDMPYTIEQFKRDLVLDHLDELTPEERLRGLPPTTIEAYLARLRGPKPRRRRPSKPPGQG